MYRVVLLFLVCMVLKDVRVITMEAINNIRELVIGQPPALKFSAVVAIPILAAIVILKSHGIAEHWMN